jgi:hypothetical protein
MTKEELYERARLAGRDTELELEALRAGRDYYFQPGVAEIHAQELEKLLNDSLRDPSGCNQAGMDRYIDAAKRLILGWAIEAGRDPEIEIGLFLKRGKTPFGERVWFRHRVRALWWEVEP